MFIRNKTGSYQGFRLNDKPVKLEPYGVTAISDLQASDDTLQLLLARGVVEKVSQKVAEEQFAADSEKAEQKAEEKRLEVAVHEETNKNSVMMARCAAKFKNGEPCGANVSVPVSEYDADKPYFCGRHKGESAEDYEKVNGAWVKKAKPVEAAPKAEKKSEGDEKKPEEPKDDAGADADEASKVAAALTR